MSKYFPNITALLEKTAEITLLQIFLFYEIYKEDASDRHWHSRTT